MQEEARAQRQRSQQEVHLEGVRYAGSDSSQVHADSIARVRPTRKEKKQKVPCIPPFSPLKQGLHPVALFRVVEPHAVHMPARGRVLPEVARRLAREHEVVLEAVHLERLGDPLRHVVEP